MHFFKKILIPAGLCFSLLGFASSCPNPNEFPLSAGLPPYPWHKSRLTRIIYVDSHTRFSKASIIAADVYGSGVVCSYGQESGSRFSIVKMDAICVSSLDKNVWKKKSISYECTASLEECSFS